MYQFIVYPLFIPANFVRPLKTHHRFEFWNVKLLIKNSWKYVAKNNNIIIIKRFVTKLSGASQTSRTVFIKCPSARKLLLVA